MRRRLKVKKKVLVILLIILVVLVFIFKPRSYNKTYSRDNYNIYEEFNNNKKEYYFKISNDDVSFDFYLDSNKMFGKGKIKEIKEFKNDRYTCIIPIINKKDTYPLCYSSVTKIDYHLVDYTLKEQFKEYIKDTNNIKDTYENIDINNLVNKSYLIWTYNGFISIKNNDYKKISLFNKDYYDISLATIVSNYMIIPNYDQEYNFSEFYIINLKNMNVEKWDTKLEISYDSYILGTYKDSVFLVDKKNKKEYEYVPKKKKIRIVGSEGKNGTIYNNKFEKININKLVSENNTFNYGYSYNYTLDNNMLLMNTTNDKTLISNKSVTKIISSNNNYVYYLCDGVLYYYDRYLGEVMVMSKFEWNFNNSNVIYPY